jgi:hypothetical protein
MQRVFLGIAAITALVLPAGARADKPDWQKHIDWAANDTGHPNCTERYLAHPVLSACLAQGLFSESTGYGNRYCAMDLAIEAAYRDQDWAALLITSEIGQCHNGGARSSLYVAGPRAVGAYLRTFDRPAWAIAVDVVSAGLALK